jgi:hypothetical protein
MHGASETDNLFHTVVIQEQLPYVRLHDKLIVGPRGQWGYREKNRRNA